MDERRQMKQNKAMMVNDCISAINEKIIKKYEFIDVNDKIRSDKQARLDQQIVNKYAERMNYFPYTHGEIIEK